MSKPSGVVGGTLSINPTTDGHTTTGVVDDAIANRKFAALRGRKAAERIARAKAKPVDKRPDVERMAPTRPR